jgi:hypothetical protein
MSRNVGGVGYLRTDEERKRFKEMCVDAVVERHNHPSYIPPTYEFDANGEVTKIDWHEEHNSKLEYGNTDKAPK